MVGAFNLWPYAGDETCVTKDPSRSMPRRQTGQERPD